MWGSSPQFGPEVPHFRGKIFNTHYLFCRKFAGVAVVGRKIATSSPANLFNLRRRSGYALGSVLYSTHIRFASEFWTDAISQKKIQPVYDVMG